MIQYLRDMYNGFYRSISNLHQQGLFTLRDLQTGQRVCHLDDHENIRKINDGGVCHDFTKVDPTNTDSVREFVSAYNKRLSNLVPEGNYLVARVPIQKDTELTKSYGVYYWIYQLLLQQVETIVSAFIPGGDKLDITRPELETLSRTQGGAFQIVYELYQTDPAAQDFFQKNGVGIASRPSYVPIASCKRLSSSRVNGLSLGTRLDESGSSS